MMPLPCVMGLSLRDALHLLEQAGRRRIRVVDVTLGRGQSWPEVRVVRVDGDTQPTLTVCRFPEAKQ
jgi:hypothetical protein